MHYIKYISENFHFLNVLNKKWRRWRCRFVNQSILCFGVRPIKRRDKAQVDSNRTLLHLQLSDRTQFSIHLHNECFPCFTGRAHALENKLITQCTAQFEHRTNGQRAAPPVTRFGRLLENKKHARTHTHTHAHACTHANARAHTHTQNGITVRFLENPGEINDKFDTFGK